MLTLLEKAAVSDSSVLLIGETGTGKEILSDYIHHLSTRALKSFIKIGLAAMPSELLESELFGFEKGSFTSAVIEKKGLFELADKGSIFLDDIDDVPLHIQTKLLRILESGSLMKIGGTVSIPINVRVIAATKVNLRTLVEQGRFRADLFYRINVIPIEIPPLRERRDDIPLLINHFITLYGNGKSIRLHNDALVALLNYNWEGNVRELKNVIQRLILFTDDEIKIEDLPFEIRGESELENTIKECEKCFIGNSMKLDEVLACLEKNLLRKAMLSSQGNISEAAKNMKLSASTFRDKLKKYNLIPSK